MNPRQQLATTNFNVGKVYRWKDEQAEVLPLPPVIAAALSATTAKQNSQPITEMISEGARNETLASLGGTMRRRGMCQQAIEDALLAENQERCDPPLEESEVKKIAARGGELVLPKASCEKHRKATSKVEDFALRRYLCPLRSHLGLPSRKPHLRPEPETFLNLQLSD